MTSKSVSTTLDQKDYDALKEQDRNISGQARHMLRRALFLAENEAHAAAINAQLYGSSAPEAPPVLDAGEDGGAGAKGFRPDTGAGSAPELSDVNHHHPGQDDFHATAHAKQEPLPG